MQVHTDRGNRWSPRKPLVGKANAAVTIGGGKGGGGLLSNAQRGEKGREISPSIRRSTDVTHLLQAKMRRVQTREMKDQKTGVGNFCSGRNFRKDKKSNDIYLNNHTGKGLK